MEAPQCLILSIKNQSSSHMEVALGSKQQLPVVEHYRINYGIVYYMGQNGCAHKGSWHVESSHVWCAIKPTRLRETSFHIQPRMELK